MLQHVLTAESESPVKAMLVELERDEARLALMSIRAQAANALAAFEDGDEEEAMEVLSAIAGRMPQSDPQRPSTGRDIVMFADGGDVTLLRNGEIIERRNEEG
jgi:cytochrome c-type biogenesis protein CcmH/NrfG